MNVRIEQVGHDHPDLHRMIDELDEDLLTRYPPEEIFTVDFSDPKVKEMRFVVAYADGQPVGCGGLRPLSGDTMELKRFYVAPAYRRHGIAGMIIRRLEDAAIAEGVTTFVLETGDGQPEALAFYRKHGYETVERFGEYADAEFSICMGKTVQAK